MPAVTMRGLFAAKLSWSSSHMGIMMLVDGGPSTEESQMLRSLLMRRMRWVGRQRSTSRDRSSNRARMPGSVSHEEGEEGSAHWMVFFEACYEKA